MQQQLRFVWGWIYVVFSALFALFNFYGAYQSLGEASLSTTLIAVGVGAAFLISSIGVAVRRTWGWIFTVALTSLFAIFCVVAMVFLQQKLPIFIEGFILMPAVVLVASFFLYLFYCVYFLRRKSLFR